MMSFSEWPPCPVCGQDAWEGKETCDNPACKEALPRVRARQEEINNLLQRTDIVEIVQQYIELHLTEKGSYRGKCPFHETEEERFFVDPTRKLFYCFVCNASGNVIRFLHLIRSKGLQNDVIK